MLQTNTFMNNAGQRLFRNHHFYSGRVKRDCCPPRFLHLQFLIPFWKTFQRLFYRVDTKCNLRIDKKWQNLGHVQTAVGKLVQMPEFAPIAGVRRHADFFKTSGSLFLRF